MMSNRSATLLSLGLLAGCLLISCADSKRVLPEITNASGLAEEPAVAQASWYRGHFQDLPTIPQASCDYHERIIDLIRTRPMSTMYTSLDDAHEQSVQRMFNAIYDAIDADLKTVGSGNWQGAMTAAFFAGYELRRVYDHESGRWFLYGYDPSNYDERCQASAGDGGAYFWINPEPGRNIVVEVPHGGAPTDGQTQGVDINTQSQGASLFAADGALAARALILNGANRCTSGFKSRCTTGVSEACGGIFRISDMSHDTSSVFHALHKLFENRHKAYFLQNHQNTSSNQLVTISDGTLIRRNPSSPATKFASAITAVLGVPSTGPLARAVGNCQGDDVSVLCGSFSVQGRYTNVPWADVCGGVPVSSGTSGRFLHLEQSSTMADDACELRGRCWTAVRDALLGTWGTETIKYNGGGLGPRQS